MTLWLGCGVVFRAAHLFHHLLVALWSACDRGLVLRGVQLRQLPDKGDHVPDQLIVVGLAPCRHRRELHSMLDDPELLGSGQVVAASKFRRGRIQALAQF